MRKIALFALNILVFTCKKLPLLLALTIIICLLLYTQAHWLFASSLCIGLIYLYLVLALTDPMISTARDNLAKHIIKAK